MGMRLLDVGSLTLSLSFTLALACSSTSAKSGADGGAGGTRGTPHVAGSAGRVAGGSHAGGVSTTGSAGADSAGQGGDPLASAGDGGTSADAGGSSGGTGGVDVTQGHGAAGAGGEAGAPCNGHVCDGACVDLDSDAQNCGACGYTCVNARECHSGRCTPAWQPISTAGAPAPRTEHGAGFVDGRYVVFGGCTSVAPTTVPAEASGGAYEPDTDVWSPLAGLVAPRAQFSAVSTGTAVYAFGGISTCWNGTTSGPALERLDSHAGPWTLVSAADAPAPRYNFALVWTGDELFVYGGGTSSTSYLAHGARLVPGESWEDASCALPGCERSGSTAFVDEGVVRVWGNGGGTAPAGLQYDLGTGAWSGWDYPAGSIEKLSGRFVDDGKRLYNLVGSRVTIYDKVSRRWSEDDAPMPAGFCPSAAVAWSGSELIGWSGECADNSISPVGGRYQPAAP